MMALQISYTIDLTHSRRPVGKTPRKLKKGQTNYVPLFVVKMILNKCWEFDITVYQIYVDFTLIGKYYTNSCKILTSQTN